MGDSCTTLCSSFPGRVVSTLAITSRAARNIQVQVFVWTYVSVSLLYIPRSRISQSCGNFLRNCGWPNLQLLSSSTSPLHNSCSSGNVNSTPSPSTLWRTSVNLAPGRYVEATSLRLEEHHEQALGRTTALSFC